MYLIFISHDPDKPWCVYDNTTNNLIAVPHVHINVPCSTVSNVMVSGFDVKYAMMAIGEMIVRDDGSVAIMATDKGNPP